MKHLPFSVVSLAVRAIVPAIVPVIVLPVALAVAGCGSSAPVEPGPSDEVRPMVVEGRLSGGDLARGRRAVALDAAAPESRQSCGDASDAPDALDALDASDAPDVSDGSDDDGAADAGRPLRGECTPGSVQSNPCIRCGTRYRRCYDDGSYGDWSLCQGERACEPGDELPEACDGGTTVRRCTSECTWGEPEDCAVPTPVIR